MKYMKYLKVIKSIGKDNKYFRWYSNIIKNSYKRDNINLTENHHILPKGFKLGGTKDKDNIAILTIKEHFICHRLLTKIVIGKYRHIALKSLQMFLSNPLNKRNLTSKQIEVARRATHLSTVGLKWYHNDELKLIRLHDDDEIPAGFSRGTGRTWNKGKEMSPEFKQKISKIMKENNPFKGKNHTTETKNKMSLAKKGKPASDLSRQRAIEVANRTYIKKEFLKRVRSKIQCDNICFTSRAEAALYFNVHGGTIRDRILSMDIKWKNWKYIID